VLTKGGGVFVFSSKKKEGQKVHPDLLDPGLQKKIAEPSSELQKRGKRKEKKAHFQSIGRALSFHCMKPQK